MSKLVDVSADALRSALADADDAKAARRLMVALAYKDGVSVATLTERYGIPRSTVYYWLDRFETMPVADAVTDDERPGRPSELGDDGRARLAADLDRSPGDCGYDADEWTVSLTRRHLVDEYGVEYSEGHVRRLLRRLDPESGGSA